MAKDLRNVPSEILAWERKRFEFFVAETKNRRPRDVIAILDKVLPPPDAWYRTWSNGRYPGDREDRANGRRGQRVPPAPEEA